MTTGKVDQVIAALKVAKGPGDVWRALSQDTMLLVGLVAVLAILLLILRIYLWPHINPFKSQWYADTKKWVGETVAWFQSPTLPGQPKKGVYPYAKVLYPTYR